MTDTLLSLPIPGFPLFYACSTGPLPDPALLSGSTFGPGTPMQWVHFRTPIMFSRYEVAQAASC